VFQLTECIYNLDIHILELLLLSHQPVTGACASGSYLMVCCSNKLLVEHTKTAALQFVLLNDVELLSS